MSQLFKTRGIVFKTIKFKETSVISTIYTERFGLQTYIIKGARGKSSKGKMALLQPLSLLDLVVYNKPNASINHISEIKCFYPYTSINIAIKKTTIAIFINEMLSKTIKEEQKDQPLFEFLINALQIFDHLEDNISNFHIQFLVKLSAYLGYAINQEWLSQHHQHDGVKDAYYFQISQLASNSFDHPMPLDPTIRRNLLKEILVFYKSNFDGIGEINSVEILKEVLK